MLAFAGLLPGLLLAQDKPAKNKQKIVIIKKSVDEDGNEVVEKIVREGEGQEKMEWKDEDGRIIIKLRDGDLEWNGLEDLDIDLEGLNLDLENHLEGKGFHFRSLDGENFTFGTPPNKAMLGVQAGQTRELINENGEVGEMEVPKGEGAAVLNVFEGSAAEEAGIQKGDIITSVDGAPVDGFEALVESLSDKAPGDKVSIGLNREGQPMVVEAILKGRETAPSVYEFKMDDEGHGLHFFSDEPGHKGKRSHKVIIIDDGDVIIEPENEDEPSFWENHADKPALELEAFEAFPNPADNQLTVRFTGKAAPVTLLLLDAAGKQVYKEYIQDFSGRYGQQISLEGVPEGLLLLTIEQEGQIFTKKVMVTRQ